MVTASLKRYAWLSIAAALATILLKGMAWWLTGSVGLLSDALESFVNLAGAMMALAMLSLAALPADDNHAHGHGKAEYFSSAFEGFLILLAAIGIAYAAIGACCSHSPWNRWASDSRCRSSPRSSISPPRASSWTWAARPTPSRWKPTLIT